jgi:hypothetical protein
LHQGLVAHCLPVDASTVTGDNKQDNLCSLCFSSKENFLIIYFNSVKKQSQSQKNKNAGQ